MAETRASAAEYSKSFTHDDGINSGNATIYEDTDKLKFGYVKSSQIFDKDVNNYNFATIEEYLSPLFSVSGDSIKAQLLNLIYPIGSIYLTIGETTPASTLGGTWERIAKGRCLFGASSNTDANLEGGRENGEYLLDEFLKSHTHDLPSLEHKHTFTGKSHNHGAGTNSVGNTKSFIVASLQEKSSKLPNLYQATKKLKVDNTSGTSVTYITDDNPVYVEEPENTVSVIAGGTIETALSGTLSTKSTGTNEEKIEILPPYLSVNIWQRTA
jgi:hypothetical protein